MPPINRRHFACTQGKAETKLRDYIPLPKLMVTEIGLAPLIHVIGEVATTA